MKKQNKIVNVFALLFAVWCLDFILTIMLLTNSDLYYEFNPIGYFFYQFGFLGFVVNFFFCGFIIFISIIIANYLIEIRTKYTKKFKKFLWILFIGLALCLESYAIINNLRLVLGH